MTVSSERARTPCRTTPHFRRRLPSLGNPCRPSQVTQQVPLAQGVLRPAEAIVDKEIL